LYNLEKKHDRKVRLHLVMMAISLLASGISATGSGQKIERQVLDSNDLYSTVGKSATLQDLKSADLIRLKTIRSIKTLIKSKKIRGAKEFELYLRLGELQSERHDYLRDLEIRDYEKRYAAWGQKSQQGREPGLSHNRSRKEMVQSANTFRRLVTKFPKHKRTPSALYALGKTLVRLGNSNATLYFQQLIKNHPNSPLVPDSYLAMGEQNFEQHKISEALKAYKAAIKYKKHRAYPYMIYKLGWAYFNATPKNPADELLLRKKAVMSFKLVVQLSKSKKRKYGRYDLREEALKDLIMVWADAEDVDSAWVYFRKLGSPEYFFTMLAQLGNLYAEQGKHKKGIRVFRRLLKEAPMRKSSFESASSLARLYEVQNNFKSLVRQVRKMTKHYSEQSPWTLAYQRNKTLIEAARVQTEKDAFHYATLLHKRGVTAKDQKQQSYAIDLYNIYLAAFPKSSNSYVARYYLADILYENRLYNKAAEHYNYIVKHYPRGKYRKDAALNAVLSLHYFIKTQPNPLEQKNGRYIGKSLPPAHKNMIIAIDKYTTLYPDNEDGDPMRYTAATTYADFKLHKKSTRRYADIVKNRPNSPQAELALSALYSHLLKIKDWPTILKWSRKFAANQQIVAAGHGAKILQQVKVSLFNNGLRLEGLGKYRSAAKQFIQFHKEFPKDKDADRALYNASVNLYKVGAVYLALETSQILLTDYPTSHLRPEVTRTYAESAEALALFDDAALHYEIFAKQYPANKRAPDAMISAAKIFKGLNQGDKSNRLYQLFSKFYPKHRSNVEATMAVALHQEKEQQWAAAAESFRKHLKLIGTSKSESSLYVQSKYAEMLLLSGRAKESRREISKLYNTLTSSSSIEAFDARRIIAKMSFESLRSQLDSFMNLKVVDPRKFDAVVSNKQQKLERLSRVFERIIKLGSPEYTVASLYQLGAMHENFARILFEAPPPIGADQSVVDQFRSELESAAFPLKEDAFRFYETAFKRSKEVQTFSKWTKLTYARITELSPESQPRIDEETQEPRFTDLKIPWSKAIAELGQQ
jgi:cellulose synthase operon protein C